jgi:two-component system, LuxR family, response regulator FixJ
MSVSGEIQTVFVVDDHPSMRQTLSNFLKAAQLNVESFDSAKSFLATYHPTRAGCLVLDIKMPEMSGLELQEYLLSIGASLPIIIVSGQAAVMEAVKAMKLGSFDFMEKPYSPEVLLKRVREALECDRNTRRSRERRGELRARFDQLTDREKQILSSIIIGKHSKIIAEDLGVSVSTIDNHRANIMKKLKAESPADLTRLAILADPSLGSIDT